MTGNLQRESMMYWESIGLHRSKYLERVWIDPSTRPSRAVSDEMFGNAGRTLSSDLL